MSDNYHTLPNFQYVSLDLQAVVSYLDTEQDDLQLKSSNNIRSYLSNLKLIHKLTCIDKPLTKLQNMLFTDTYSTWNWGRLLKKSKVLGQIEFNIIWITTSFSVENKL